MPINSSINQLVADGKIIPNIAVLDPNNTYVEVGSFFQSNRKKDGDNSYHPFAVPLSQIGGGGPPVVLPVDNKNWLRVDVINGNDSIAVKNNEFLPYQSINKAIADAVAGDLIIVDPGTYYVTLNMFKPGVSYYVYKNAIINISPGSSYPAGYPQATTCEQTLYYSVTAGPGFVVGDIITTSSGATGVVTQVIFPGAVLVTVTALAFVVPDTITGSISGTVADIYFVQAGANQDISILGNGTFNFYVFSLLGGAYCGNFTMEADYIFYQQNTYYGGAYSGNVKITCNVEMRLGYGTSSNFYWDNPEYFFGASRPNRFEINASSVVNQGSAFVLYRDNVELRFNFKNYTYAGFGGINAKDFYKTNFGSGGLQPLLTYDVLNTVHIDKFVCNKRELVAFGIPLTNSDSSFIFPAGSNRSKTIITGNYTYIGNGVNDGGISCLIQALGCAEQIFFNGIATIESGSMFLDFNSLPECKVVIEGKVYVNNSVINFINYLHTVYFIVGCNFQLKADTIVDNPVNPCLTQSSYNISSLPTSQVEIVNCQLVNTNAAGLQTALIQQLGPFLGPVVWGYTRLQNAKLVTTGTISIDGVVLGQHYEIISAYMNKPTNLVTNLLAPPLGEVVDPAITANNI
jgi:hypothetical protein